MKPGCIGQGSKINLRMKLVKPEYFHQLVLRLRAYFRLCDGAFWDPNSIIPGQGDFTHNLSGGLLLPASQTGPECLHPRSRHQ
jgi:hypothetical protein